MLCARVNASEWDPLNRRRLDYYGIYYTVILSVSFLAVY